MKRASGQHVFGVRRDRSQFVVVAGPSVPPEMPGADLQLVAMVSYGGVSERIVVQRW